MFTLSFARSAALALVTLGLVACTEESDEGGTEETASAITIAAAIESGTAVVGQNALIITLTDAEGSSVVGATVTVDPQMPSMGHGSREVPVVTDNGDGTYRAFPVTLQMAGAWEVHVSAEAGDQTATLVLDYNVQ